MINIVRYIENLLTKVRGKTPLVANKLMNGRGKIIIGGGDSNREYNKNNLQVAFNRYDQDAPEPGEHQFKSQ